MTTSPKQRRRRRTTVGSIVVPELPWKREQPDTRAMDLLREDDPPLTPADRRELTRLMDSL